MTAKPLLCMMFAGSLLLSSRATAAEISPRPELITAAAEGSIKSGLAYLATRFEMQ